VHELTQCDIVADSRHSVSYWLSSHCHTLTLVTLLHTDSRHTVTHWLSSHYHILTIVTFSHTDSRHIVTHWHSSHYHILTILSFQFSCRSAVNRLYYCHLAGIRSSTIVVTLSPSRRHTVTQPSSHCHPAVVTLSLIRRHTVTQPSSHCHSSVITRLLFHCTYTCFCIKYSAVERCLHYDT